MHALTSRVLTFTAILVQCTDALHGLNVNLVCQECNASFYCNTGIRYQCPLNSLAVSWPDSQISGCTCNDGFQATPERDGCFVGETRIITRMAMPNRVLEAGGRPYTRRRTVHTTACAPRGTTDCLDRERVRNASLGPTPKSSTPRCALRVPRSLTVGRGNAIAPPARAMQGTRGRTADLVERASRARSRRRPAVLPARSVA